MLLLLKELVVMRMVRTEVAVKVVTMVALVLSLLSCFVDVVLIGS